MPIIFLIALGALFFVSSKIGSGDNMTRLFNLHDIDPDNQGGNFKRDYDLLFLASAEKYSVPFALLKAHAIRESSLNPDAFMDENPKGLSSRKGWASRGLMQLLFWPGSDRFEKYGFARNAPIDDLFEPDININIAAQLIRDNLIASKGKIRDAINMYNTGKKESDMPAPNGYTDAVYKYYLTLIKEN